MIFPLGKVSPYFLPHFFDPKTAGGCQFHHPPVVFRKMYFLKKGLKPWFIMIFNIILRHIFPGNFKEFLQVVQKIGINSLSIFANFYQFSPIFLIF